MARVNLAKIPLADLAREIERRRGQLARLVARRDELNRRIAELEKALAPLTSGRKKRARRKITKRPVRRRRPRGQKTLVECLAEALAGKESLSVAEATEAVLALGYKSRAKDPRVVVRQALYSSDRFKRVARGRFALKQ